MAEDKGKLHIRLHLYDMDISVNVPRNDEADFRSAAKLINETINTYANVFGDKKSVKELLYMAMIDIALQLVQTKAKNDTKPFSDILVQLTKEIEEALE
ncbi:MAG: cell division protein ZapA [Prevotella sp.]|nr:cell division protein ZapA [Prevotella sp.]